MYLSRIKLDPERRETQKALASPNIFHGAVESCFEYSVKRKLWRIDPLCGSIYLLILSEEYPDLSVMQTQFGYPAIPGESKDYGPLLDRVITGTAWRFRLAANPVKSHLSDSNQRGHIKAEPNNAKIREWLQNRAEKYGFELRSDEFDIVSDTWYSFRHGENAKAVKFRAVVYEGVLRVSDSGLLKEALINGIGREKAYGLGMLTLVKI